MGSNLPRQSVTIGSSIWQMSCKEYDELINTGFRRSGTFLYKTDLLRSCCRLYTIRTKLEMCKLTKEHRKVVNRFIKEICPELPQPKKNTFDLNRLYEAQLQSKRFKTRFEPSKFSKEKFELYKKYQVSVHNDDPDDVTESSFKGFYATRRSLTTKLMETRTNLKDLNSKIGENQQNHELVLPTNYISWMGN